MNDTARKLKFLHDANKLDMVVFPMLDHNSALLLNFLQDSIDLFNSSFITLMPWQVSWDYLKLRLDSQLYFYDIVDSDSIALFEVYSIKNGPQITRQIGNWNTTNGLNVPKPNIWERRQNLLGVELVNGVLPWSVFSQFEVDRDGNPRSPYSGIFGDMMTRMAKKLNFTLAAKVPEDGKWGSFEADGSTWNGMVRMLLEGDIDICTAGLSQTEERSKVIQFSIPLIKEEVTLLAPRIGDTSSQFWVYLEIFPLESWIVCITVFITISFCHIGVEARGDEVLVPMRLLNSFAVNGLYLLLLSVDFKKTSSSSRMLFMFSNLFAFLIFTYYTCDLTARMTSKPKPLPIRYSHQVS